MAEEKVNRLQQRIIEARLASQFMKAFGRELGLERAKQIVQEVNEESSRQYGKEMAQSMGSNTMADLAQEVQTWGEGGALDEKVLELTNEVYRFNVTRCAYADKYHEMGLGEFGYCLSCCRDAPFVEGFNPHIELVRTQTIMEGAEFCDFHYRYKK